MISSESSNIALHFQDFIGRDAHIFTYLHNTPTWEIAQTIMNRGFKFESHLDHTSDIVSGHDLVELKYFRLTRMRYGIYTIVIQISKSLIDYYSERLKNTHFHFSEVLSKHEAVMSQDHEPIYTLHEQFVRGCFNQQTMEKHFNPKFDPYKQLPVFEENLLRLRPELKS